MAFDLATFGSVIGALGVGSVAGQWLAGSKDRRAARADALLTLANVELARWAVHPESDVPSFRQAARDMRTRALIARLPRPAVDMYLWLATTAHGLSVEDAEDDPTQDDEFAGGIDGDFDELVRDAARILSNTIWALPVWRTLRMRIELRALERRRETMPPAVRRHLVNAKRFGL